MGRVYLFVLLFLSPEILGQTVSGIVVDEDRNKLSEVLVLNTTTGAKVFTDYKGEFILKIAPGDELRVVRPAFERRIQIINPQNLLQHLMITLTRSAANIEEVRILRLTGNLNEDSKNLTRTDRVYQLQKEIGVPLPPEKPREQPAELVKNILLPLVGVPPTLNIQAIYDVASGKAKRQKRFYKYEDLQDDISWVRSKVGDDYFTKMQIPRERISEFLQFSIGVKPHISKYIKARHVSKVLLQLEDIFPVYMQRLSNSAQKK